MNEKRILTVQCLECRATLQIKTRSIEKIVTCPKCQATLTVSAAAGAAPTELPFVVMIDEQPSALPMAEPLPMLPMAGPLPFGQPLANSPRRWRQPVVVAGSIGGAALVAAILLIVLRPGGGAADGTSSPSVSDKKTPMIGSAVGLVTSQETVVASQAPEDGEKTADAGGQTQNEPAVAEQGQNYFESLSKAQINQGLNNAANQGGNGFPSGFQNLTPRDQARNWDLQNAGRLGAMGLKKVQVPRR